MQPSSRRFPCPPPPAAAPPASLVANCLAKAHGLGGLAPSLAPSCHTTPAEGDAQVAAAEDPVTGGLKGLLQPTSVADAIAMMEEAAEMEEEEEEERQRLEGAQ